MIYNMDCIIGTKQYIKDESVDLIVTDPPYNLGFGGTSQTKSKKPRCSIIANDKLSIVIISDLLFNGSVKPTEF